MKKRTQLVFLTAILAFFLCTAALWADVPEEGLAAYWPFDEGGGYAAYDKAGDNDAMIQGPRHRPGRFRTCLEFDGIDDYVEIEPTEDFDFAAGGEPNAFTIGFWFRSCDVLPSFVMSRNGNQPKIELSAVHQPLNQIALQVRIQGSDLVSEELSFSPAKTLDCRVWHHAAVTLTSDGLLTLYMDLNQTSRMVDLHGIHLSQWDRIQAGSQGFGGQLDEVRVYNRALSGEEVGQLYQQAVPRTLFESAAGDFQPYGLGLPVHSQQLIGTRFHLGKPTTITHIGARVRENVEGMLSAAIVALDGPGDLPDGWPLTWWETISSRPLDPETMMVDVYQKFEIPYLLEPGFYALVIGAGLDGTTGSGELQKDIGQYPGADYIAWDPVSGWDEVPYNAGLRFVIEGIAEPNEPVYCPALSIHNSFEHIALCEFEQIVQHSASRGYRDFTDQTAQVEQYTSYPIHLRVGSSTADDRCVVFCDWNQDGDFAEADEKTVLTEGPIDWYGEIEVPGTAMLGETRMRVMVYDAVVEEADPSGCCELLYGEVEDYTLDVHEKVVAIGGTVAFPEGIDPNGLTVSAYLSYESDQPVSSGVMDPNGVYEVEVIAPFRGSVRLDWKYNDLHAVLCPSFEFLLEDSWGNDFEADVSVSLSTLQEAGMCWLMDESECPDLAPFAEGMIDWRVFGALAEYWLEP